MARIQCSFYSHTLGMETIAEVILPLGRKNVMPEERKKDIPVLYLLHGLTEDHTVWTRRTAIERYVMDMNIAVVMPAVQRSFYIDAKYGLKYFQFVSDELPRLMQSMFGLSDKREDNFVAGLSMGGYGALKTALSCSDRFCAAASFSGAVDIKRVFDDENSKDESYATFGGSIEPCNDLYYLAENAENMPAIYQSCGEADFLYYDNNKFAEFMQKINKNFKYYVEEGASHTWDFWDREIQKVLVWIEEMNERV